MIWAFKKKHFIPTTKFLSGPEQQDCSTGMRVFCYFNISPRRGSWMWTLTGTVLYGGRPRDRGGPVEGAGEAVRAAMFRLVVISGTRVAGNQAGAGEMTCWTGDCTRGRKKKKRSTGGKREKKGFEGQVKWQDHPKTFNKWHLLVGKHLTVPSLKGCRLFMYFNWKTGSKNFEFLDYSIQF